MSDQQDAYDNGYKGDMTYSAGSGDAHRQGLEDGGHNGGSACFPGDAMIRTPSGLVRLDSLSAGDLIVSWQESAKQWVTRPIKAVKAYGAKPVVAVRLSDGRLVRVTASHTILTVDAWKRVGKLCVGDVVPSASNCAEGGPVIEIAPTGEAVPVFNLICEGEYTFVADGVIAHSFTVLRRTRTALHRCADRARALRAALAPTRADRPTPLAT